MKTNGFKLTKKGVVALSLMLLLLAGAIYLNIKLGGSEQNAEAPVDSAGVDAAAENNTDTSGSKPTESNDSKTVNADVYSGYFVNFRDERNLIRSQEIDYLRMIINESSSDAETIANAEERLMELVSNMEQEFSIESQIRSKGFLDAAVTFRNDSVTVVIDGDSLTDEEVARILDIVRNETGAPASAIRISLSRGNA